MTLDQAAMSLLASSARVIGPGGGGTNVDGIDVADAVIAGPRVNWNAQRFGQASRVKVVARTGIGCDNVDLPAATAAGVCITNTPDAPTESTAEYTIGLLLCLARRLCVAERRFRAEGWIDATQLIGIELAGKTLVVIGLGRIGLRVAEIARCLRMEVVAFDRSADATEEQGRGIRLVPDLCAALAMGDFISLHLPLTPQTRGLIGPREIAHMKRGAMLINTARGAIVVEAALVAALKSGQLGVAAIDVWDPEPAMANNPLLGLENVVAMPHLASSTVEGRRRNQVGAVECALTVLRGERPASLVNREVWASRR